MLEVIRKTWIATFALIAVVVGIGVWQGSLAGVPRLVASLTVVTPLLWWWIVARRGRAGPGRGALAGALCAAIAFAIPILSTLLVPEGSRSNRETGALGMVAVVTSLAALWAVAIPLGAFVGATVAFLQRRWGSVSQS